VEKAEDKFGLPINATLFSVGGWKQATAAGVKVNAKVAGADLNAEVYAGRLKGVAGASGGLNLANAELSAGVYSRLEAHLVGVSAGGKRKFGNDAINTTTSVWSNAYVGGELGAKAGVTFNPRSGSAGVNAGLSAFAGAKARGIVRQGFGVAGEEIGRVGISGEAWAGIGASADVNAGFEDGHLKLGASLGAALGVGGKVGFSVDINVVGTAKVIGKAATAVADTATDVATDVGNAFRSGWSQVKKLW
jgi:hypothetical protein